MIEKSTLITFSSRHRNNQKPRIIILDSEMKDLWELKTQYQRKDEYTGRFYDRAGIWAEFGKIVCISVGYFTNQRGYPELSSLPFWRGKKILNDFNNLLNTHFNPQHVLCGHNAKEFDIPFIARRMIINQIVIPNKLNLFKKPWKFTFDTLELWKFGDYKHYTSLKLMCKVLGIPSPKVISTAVK
jgi:hypothetical protein